MHAVLVRKKPLLYDGRQDGRRDGQPVLRARGSEPRGHVDLAVLDATQQLDQPRRPLLVRRRPPAIDPGSDMPKVSRRFLRDDILTISEQAQGDTAAPGRGDMHE